MYGFIIYSDILCFKLHLIRFEVASKFVPMYATNGPGYNGA